MKLDWDYIRELLISVEEERDLFSDVPEEPKWTDQAESTFVQEMAEFRKIEGRLFGHLELLLDNNFLAGIKIIRDASGGFHYSRFSPRLTLSGHELLADLRSKVLWEQVKSIAKNKGIELTFDTIKALGKIALQKILGE